MATSQALALERVDWLAECKTALEAQARGATYSYSKIRDFLMEHVEGIPTHLRIFLLAVTRRTYSGKYEGQDEKSEKTIAEKIDRCLRTVQYDVAQAEARGLVTVVRRPGRENDYHLGVSLLIKAGALYMKAKAELAARPAPPPSPKEVNKLTQKSAYIYACWWELMNSGKTREEADAELLLRFPELRQTKKQQPAGVVNGMVSALQKAIGSLSKEKSISPPRAG